MALVKKLSARLQNHPKRVVYPDGTDSRVIKAARQFATRKLGVPILLGNKSEIEAKAKSLDVRLDGIKIIDPITSDDSVAIMKLMSGLPKFKGFDPQEINTIALQPIYYATMMVATGRADAMVAGATSITAHALRPVFKIIPLQKGFSTASSMMIISTGNKELGIEGDLFLSDCGVIPEPTENQLCDIAITTAVLVNHLTLQTPRVAMLAYSSKSENSKAHSVLKVKSATFLAHEKAKTCDVKIEIDGELQIDAALQKEVAEMKGLTSSVAGHANVLIFPDLNAGNIASKSLRVISSANCYGQILTGLTKPIAEISRGATVDEIFGTSVIVGAQAVDRRFISTESL
jgi:phosphate acetyltransferase